MRRIETKRTMAMLALNPCAWPADDPVRVIRECDWRKIRRVLRAVDAWKDDASHATTKELLLAIDALNRETRK